MKLLFFGESPCLETGAGRVDRHLLDAIVACGIDVEVLATSHFFGEEYDHARYPYKITAIESYKELPAAIAAGVSDPDCLLISGDMHVPNLLSDLFHQLPCIVLAAIDGVVRHKDQVKSLEMCYWPAVYSQFARDQVLGVMPDLKLSCIQLGCEPEIFFPLSEEERQAYRRKAFGIGDDTFLVMCANRNQMRKDLGRSMKGFHLFHKKVPNSLLYMHSKVQDVGGNLITQAFLSGLEIHGSRPEVIFTPPEYNEISGFSREKLNKMYNAADAVITTAQGEGWGLTTTEAMAAGTIVVGPTNTTFFEILGRQEERGYLVPSGDDDLWSIYYGTDDAPRPIASAVALGYTLEYVYHHQEEAREKAEVARQWTEQHTWQNFREEWKHVLWRVRSSLEERGKMGAI